MAYISETEESELEDIIDNDYSKTETDTLMGQENKRRCGLVLPLVVIMLGIVLILAAAVSLALLLLRPKTTTSNTVYNVTTSDLTGNWHLKNSDGSIKVTAVVPETVHSALFRAHIIQDPYSGFNDINLSWVYKNTWIYTRQFTVRKNMSRALHLVCEGLDTIANIAINGVNIGKANNQFLRYIYDITTHVKPGELNEVSIAFSPPVDSAKDLALANPKVPSTCDKAKYPMECHVNMIRKSQASFGWRWSPVLPTQGIWRDIYTVEFSTCRILDILTETIEVSTDSIWDLRIEAQIDCVTAEPCNATIMWELMDNDIRIKSLIHNITLTQKEHSLQGIMYNLKVDSWWPRNHGNQTLYTLKTTLSVNDEQPHTKTVKIGFRTVKIVEDVLDDGYNFYFVINNRPIYLKGSTWIPADALQGRVDKSRVQGLLQSAVDANMNVLRVPGSAVYESDYFYGLADEYGLMVWQDFMFSSALYPGNPEFIELARKEVTYQLRRLVHHPCIIAWAGNDNIERAIVENWFDIDGSDYGKYMEDYQKLFSEVLREEVEGKTSVPYLLSSPSNGKLSLNEGGISMDPSPNSPNYGDVHSHQFLEDCMDLRNTSAARLVSNYGWGSWPTYHSLLKVANQSDLVYQSKFFQHRQHDSEAATGTDQMIHRYFNWTSHLETEDGFKYYIYLTQLVQSLCLKAEIEYYRRMQPSGTRGAILWQLNELWTAPSGATLELDGTWKMAHYHAVQALSDVIVVVTRNGNDITGYIINDSLKDLNDYRAQMMIYQWDEGNYIMGLGLMMSNVQYPAQKVTKAFTAQMSRVTDYCPELELCYITFQVWNIEDGGVFETTMYPTPFKDAIRMKPSDFDAWKVAKTGQNTFEINVSCSVGSAFVWIDAAHIRGWFSPNGVSIPCGSMSTKITFRSLDNNVTEEALTKSLTFTSLADVMLAL